MSMHQNPISAPGDADGVAHRMAATAAVVPMEADGGIGRRTTRQRKNTRKLISLSPTLPAMLAVVSAATGCSSGNAPRREAPIIPQAAAMMPAPVNAPATAPATAAADAEAAKGPKQAQSAINSYIANLNAALGRGEDAPSRPQASTIAPVATPTVISPQPATAPISAASAPAKPAAQAPHPQPIAVAPTPPAAPLPPTYDALLALLRERANNRPQQLNYALALRLLELAEPPAEQTALKHLSAADKKVVEDIAAAIQAISAKPAGPSDALTDRAAPLLAATQNWQTANDLALPRLMLASKVDSFGVVTPLDGKFTAGQKHPVVIYCEVANFTSKHLDSAGYQTHMIQQETLLTNDGLLVYRANPADIQDTCLNPRKDFYLAKRMTIPDTLPVGKYTLRMSVTDILANKQAQENIPVEIVAR